VSDLTSTTKRLKIWSTGSQVSEKSGQAQARWRQTRLSSRGNFAGAVLRSREACDKIFGQAQIFIGFAGWLGVGPASVKKAVAQFAIKLIGWPL